MALPDAQHHWGTLLQLWGSRTDNTRENDDRVHSRFAMRLNITLEGLSEWTVYKLGLDWDRVCRKRGS